MGWHIAVMENTVRLTPEQAEELNPKLAETSPDHFYDGDDPLAPSYERNPDTFRVEQDGFYKPNFDSDNMEHMDWLTGNEDAMKILAAAGVAGRVCFGSLVGDNANDFWGVEFASGQYRELSGTVEWTPGTSHPG